VLGEHVVQRWQQVGRAQGRRRLWAPDVQLLRARSRSRTRACPLRRRACPRRRASRSAGSAPPRATWRQVRVARGVEQRDDLVDAVEVDGTLAGSSFRLAGVHPNRVACDQFAIGGDLEDLPEAGDRVVDRLEPTATPRRRRPTCRRPPSALA
jgi:hypothetical protein